MILESEQDFLGILKSQWKIVKKLHSINEPKSVTELSALLGIDKRNVSKEINELEKIPGLLHVDRYPHVGGGRDLKMIILTEHGYKMIQGIVAFWEKSRGGASSFSPTVESVTFAINHVLNGTTTESRDTAWIELKFYASTTKLWEYEQIWSLIEQQIFFVKIPGEEYYNVLRLYVIMLEKAYEEVGGYRNPVTVRTKRKYMEWLMHPLRDSDPKWYGARSTIMDICKYIWKEDEKAQVFWNIWEKGARNISNDAEFEHFARALYKHLTFGSLNRIGPIRKMLYAMLEDPDEKLRKRARAMHGAIIPIE